MSLTKVAASYGVRVPPKVAELKPKEVLFFDGTGSGQDSSWIFSTGRVYYFGDTTINLSTCYGDGIKPLKEDVRCYNAFKRTLKKRLWENGVKLPLAMTALMAEYGLSPPISIKHKAIHPFTLIDRQMKTSWVFFTGRVWVFGDAYINLEVLWEPPGIQKNLNDDMLIIQNMTKINRRFATVSAQRQWSILCLI